ncbi:plasmodesmata-located protein 6 isoform X2 [Nicotiana tabacum]|uniref:Plasmodesmata-located protein 6 isoform X2 n=3 Tax=Nicotiana TaxID=4085 RepID=A0AC58SWX9_TOBAC|nr:PREDICTED: cysteine-rich repeat secretory protein 12-like [Nicotiana sylvestris]XP_016468917.1 PREDICTED: cysteine-rich repeat secretory protein 12-like [Nicotiana tabacum]
MKLYVKEFSLHVLLVYMIIIFLFFTYQSNASIQSFVYGGCSQQKYNPGTVYESNVNSLLTSLVNSASYANFNNFKISLPGSSQNDIVYGLFQCRGDLGNSDCRKCVATAVSRVGTLCTTTCGGALQLDGCFVKYDNVSFLGVEDKGVVMHKCGPSIMDDNEMLTRNDAVLTYLGAVPQGQYFRVGGSGKIQAVAQCTQDLSVSECDDCLSEAIRQLKSECGSSPWGDMFMTKCYARFSERGFTSKSGDEDVEKTLAITIGLIAGVAVLIVFLSILNKLCEKKGGK